MKTLKSFLILLAGLSGTGAWAARNLSCELADLATQRVIERKVSEIGAAPILLLFSHGSMTGTVRDLPADAETGRSIQLQLSHRQGRVEGVAYAFGSYFPDQEPSADPIAEARLDEPVFRRTISLRCFLQVVELKELSKALSTITYEWGYGIASGWCDARSSWFCVDDVKRRARDQAARDGQWRCEMRQGRADTFMPSCQDNCTPFLIPDDGRQHLVNCSTNCSVRCEIP